MTTPCSRHFGVLLTGCWLLIAPHTSFGQLTRDIETGSGYLNPSDTSWRYYVDQMNRFPERLGFICMNGYELNKTGDHDDGFKFMAECARRGNPASMVYLSQMYADGLGVEQDPSQARAWLRRAAETGYSAAEFHYGTALLLGIGGPADPPAARYWLRRAAEHGDDDARSIVNSDFSLRIAAQRRPRFHTALD